MIRADGATTDACGAAAGLGGAIDPAGLVSGITSPDRIGYLAGVFLPDAPVTSPPPFGLDLEGGYESERFAPLLQQVFFIGDGVTSAGRIRRFRVPDGATRLYLGYADAYGLVGPPGYYVDNSGALPLASCSAESMRQKRPVTTDTWPVGNSRATSIPAVAFPSSWHRPLPLDTHPDRVKTFYWTVDWAALRAARPSQVAPRRLSAGRIRGLASESRIRSNTRSRALEARRMEEPPGLRTAQGVPWSRSRGRAGDQEPFLVPSSPTP